ncbi:four helix bundle suffix domain-containing protein [Prosthecochloris sp.]|uniref:four helix bundle suffix domain-containing protein n=1 Tax=Prosthecochloris sp. TaxID=290513 RepID=UPI00339030F1
MLIERSDPAVAATIIIGLITVTAFLLCRQLKWLEKSFVQESGLSERMISARLRCAILCSTVHAMHGVCARSQKSS